MKINLVILLMVITQLITVYSHPFFAVIPLIVSSVGTAIRMGVKESQRKWMVEVHNEGRHHAHLWCASKDDKIGGDDGIWVPPGEKLVWGFRPNLSTQFWCNMDWYGQRVGWDVYVNNWHDAPNPTKWSIKDDGVYDQWKNRRWREYNS